jgi:hypothetical protein
MPEWRQRKASWPPRKGRQLNQPWGPGQPGPLSFSGGCMAQKKFSEAWRQEQAKRDLEMAEWRERVVLAAVVLAGQLPTLEGVSIPFNVARPLADLEKVVEDKPLPLLKGDWEEREA